MLRWFHHLIIACCWSSKLCRTTAPFWPSFSCSMIWIPSRAQTRHLTQTARRMSWTDWVTGSFVCVHKWRELNDVWNDFVPTSSDMTRSFATSRVESSGRRLAALSCVLTVNGMLNAGRLQIGNRWTVSGRCLFGFRIRNCGLLTREPAADHGLLEMWSNPATSRHIFLRVLLHCHLRNRPIDSNTAHVFRPNQHPRVTIEIVQGHARQFAAFCERTYTLYAISRNQKDGEVYR